MRILMNYVVIVCHDKSSDYVRVNDIMQHCLMIFIKMSW